MSIPNGAIKALRPYIAKSLAVLSDNPKIRRVTTYISPKLTVKVTRQSRIRINARQQTLLLSVGAPNFLERRFLKSAKAKKLPQQKHDLFTGS